MSMLLASGVVGTYLAGLLGFHRLNVRRLRRAAGGFPTLGWLDWDSLLSGLLPPGQGAATGVSRALGGGPLPELLQQSPAPEAHARLQCICALVEGAQVQEEQLTAAGFSGGEARWVALLSQLGKAPEQALLQLESLEPASPAELYLREHLRLELRTHALNLELSVFAARRRLTLGIARFGEHPALFFARARAAALLGFNGAAIDDLARAVYFSEQRAFYLRAVLEVPYIAEFRPALAQQCRSALDPSLQVE